MSLYLSVLSPIAIRSTAEVIGNTCLIIVEYTAKDLEKELNHEDGYVGERSSVTLGIFLMISITPIVQVSTLVLLQRYHGIVIFHCVVITLEQRVLIAADWARCLHS